MAFVSLEIQELNVLFIVNCCDEVALADCYGYNAMSDYSSTINDRSALFHILFHMYNIYI